MSHVDPYGGTEPRGWQRPEQPRGTERTRGPERRDVPPGRPWPAGDDDTLVRARHTGVAPDTYPPVPAYPDQHEPAVPTESYLPPDLYAPAGRPGAGRGAAQHNGHHDLDPEPGPWARDRVDGGPAYPDPDDVADAPTNPVGWPRVGPVPETGPDPRGVPGPETGPARTDGPEPRAGSEVRVDDDGDPEESPPRRRGPGRRRATRSGKPAGTGRAGRNLPAAIGVGLGLGAAIVVPLFLFRPAFLAVIAAAIAVGIWEMTRAVRANGAHPPFVPLVAGGLLMVGLAWWAGPDALSLGLLVTVLATLVWRLGDGPAGYQRDMTAATLIAVYVPFLGGFAALLAAAPGDGHLRVLVTLVAVVLSDTGGYAAGVAFGKHPMAPSVSPKKSWEGFAGSVTAAALGSALLLWLLLDVAPWWGALFGLAVSVAAVLGDLAESMIKRDLKIKDMSNLLPGHGGLMDRLDSILFAVPTGYLLLALMAPMG
ncbi:phosphatidate cytidylyltransferase [Plantactinospora sp. B5E13]|uniref:phosphatidate cytidylyltransferase n=1 Tax=Plantactinospora sp. B5E13 TaxID=3153758 RepID=UPI00325E2B2F